MTMRHRTGPLGVQIFPHGKALRGITPNGFEITIKGPPAHIMFNLMTVDIDVIGQIEQEMIRTIKFLSERKPVNAP